MSGSCVRVVGLSLLAGLLATSSLTAQDYFEQKKRELAVQAQQTASEVTSALEKSRQLEKTNASQAKALLEKSLLTVNDSTALDDKQRADLRGRLLSRLKEVEATDREQRVKSDAGGKSAADKAARDEKERQALEKLENQQKQAFDTAKDRINSNKKTVNLQNQIRSDAEKGATGVALDIQKSGAKMQEERITARFIEISSKRSATTKLSKDEVALVKALNSTMSVDFNKAKFKEVMDYIAERTGLNIFPDASSLKDAMVDYDAEVSLKANKLTVRTILKRVLADLQLTYVIKEGTIQVITPDRAKDYVVTRIYPVGDLVSPVDQRWGPVANQIQMAQQANQLIQLIMNTIDPGSWAGVSDRGFGTISYDPAQKALVIRHTAEMHFMLGGSFGR